MFWWVWCWSWFWYWFFLRRSIGCRRCTFYTFRAVGQLATAGSAVTFHLQKIFQLLDFFSTYYNLHKKYYRMWESSKAKFEKKWNAKKKKRNHLLFPILVNHGRFSRSSKSMQCANTTAISANYWKNSRLGTLAKFVVLPLSCCKWCVDRILSGKQSR